MLGNTSPVDKSESKRWLVIGAYQAGASDRKIARMCGINQSSIRRIILNFQKTGSPTLPRGLSKKEKLKPFVEYDENGNLIDSEDELSVSNKEAITVKMKMRKPVNLSKEMSNTGQTSAKDLISYVLNKAQKPEHVALKQETKPAAAYVWHSHDLQQEDQLEIEHINQPMTSKSELFMSPPLSDPSVSPKPKCDTILGYEAWTTEEDKILMAHVLTRLSGSRWDKARSKLQDKHSAIVCEKRWEALRDSLLKGTENSNTRE